MLSAIAALASASGVSRERKVFMDLVQKAIADINGRLSLKGGSALEFTAKVQLSSSLRSSPLEHINLKRGLLHH